MVNKYKKIRNRFLSTFDFRNEPEEHKSLVLTKQFKIIINLMPTIAGLKAIVLIFIAFIYTDIYNSTIFFGLAITLVFFNILGSVMWWPSNKFIKERATNKDYFLLILLISVIAFFDAKLATELYMVGSESQKLIIIAIYAGIISVGTLLYSPLTLTGISWSISICAFLIIFLDKNADEEISALKYLLIFYGIILVWLSTVISTQYRKSISSELKIKNKNEVVSLLLNDFEQNASDWLWETDIQGYLSHTPQQLLERLNLSSDEIEKLTWLEILKDRKPEDESIRSYQTLTKLISNLTPFPAVVIPVTINNKKCWWSLSGKPLRDNSDNFIGWRGVGSDITPLYERDQELLRMAKTDSLTGLANRYKFNSELANCFNEKDSKPCKLILIDLDNFKNINDTLGHSAGDDVLKIIAKRLQSIKILNSVFARLGGDEFAILIKNDYSIQQLKVFSFMVKREVKRPITLGDHNIDLQCSIGVSSNDGLINTAEELVNSADIALYIAKSSGRNTITFYEASMGVKVKEKLALMDDLKSAFHNEDFHLVFQPQIDIANNKVIGFEALVRWQHPRSGKIFPSRFIPLAEESGLILELGRWILIEACKHAMMWPKDIRISINISAIEFQRSDILANIKFALQESRLQPHRLELELTESALVSESGTMQEILLQIKQLGVRISIDDFGTGYSSLSYLQNFPLDQLKIDQSFVRALSVHHPQDSENSLPNKHRTLEIIKAIYGIAVALDLEIVVEGVETVSELKQLQSMGPVIIQGYLFSRPIPALEVDNYLKRFSLKVSKNENILKLK
ncbi:MAG: EAL domain-containing protein [Oleibacter sp.]|nr:EAL domain-containing protein [Thalassolituus sp.]